MKYLYIVVLMIVCGGLVVWYSIMARERLQNNMAKIHEGMSKAEVMQILGQPKEFKKPCNSSHTGCDQDLVYPVPLGLASFWTVSIDTSGHVIDKFHWQSP